MQTRINKRHLTTITLAADSSLDATPEITVGPQGFVAFQVLVDNGAGAAPSDTPIGTWLLHASAGTRFTPIANIPDLTTMLARVAPAGNTLIDAWVILLDVPGSRAKLQYKFGSGGAGNSRATVDVSSW